MKQTKTNQETLIKIGIIALLAVVLAVITLNCGAFAFADDPAPASTAGKSTFLSGVIKYVGGVGGALVGIFLIVSIVKDGIQFAKGGGQVSPFKIVGKVLFLILMIGLIFLAVNYEKIGETGQSVGQGVIDTLSSELKNSDVGLNPGTGGLGN